VCSRRAPSALAAEAVLADNPVMSKSPYSIHIAVQTRFIDEQSAPAENRYVFAYSIRIANEGSVPAKLLTRHWVITDANGKVQEVRGDGVVGEQPHLLPGEDFHYTSGAVLETAVGTMRGSYQMLADDGHRFDAPIAQFTLSIPRTVH
jgi:ApaG protein